MTPNIEAELAELIASASGPLAIKGGDTRGIVQEGAPLDTSALSGIRLYEPGALTMVAGAGTPVQEIEEALAKEGQMLAFEPTRLGAITGATGHSTIGGIFATNASGPRRVQTGAARDFLLGVRFVDGNGQIIQNGGRVMKNVTGYDLVKLMAGSHGTLGVLSEVSFKILPRPETTRTLVLRGLSVEAACAAMRAALGSPFDVTGAAHDPGQGYEPVTHIRVEGFEDSTAYRADRLEQILSEWSEDIDCTTDPVDWEVFRDGGVVAGEGDIWRISVKPTDGPAVASALNPLALSFDWGGGLIWARTKPGTDVRALMGGIAGHATLIRGDGFARVHPDPAPVAALAKGLRKRFDPRGILNPGLMG